MQQMLGTTIVAVKKDGKCAVAGDGQVTFGENTIMKHTAKKVRRIYHDSVVTGFAGTVADAFSLLERFEAKLEKYSGSLKRAAVSLAQEWRTDKAMRQLNAMLIVADKDELLIVSGTGEVIDPDDGIAAIGSGGMFALSAAKALKENTDLSAAEIATKAIKIASDICIYTNSNITMEEIMFTPRETVEALDKYIVGQDEAKRAVAIALRNRYRRSCLSPEMREEITPKNIIMVGPTGVGKTEIARRLAKLVDAPLVKVEATKFTEVGYVGRDVDSIVRDLVEASIRLCKQKRYEAVETVAKAAAEQRLVELLMPTAGKKVQKPFNPIQLLLGSGSAPEADTDKELSEEEKAEHLNKRQQIAQQLSSGLLENELVEVEVEQQNTGSDTMLAMGIDINLNEMMGGLIPKNKKKRRVKVSEARRILTQEESEKLIDMDEVIREAIEKAEQDGIVFIDEIDKIAGNDRASGPDVSREGVQRDILPIVEGCTVNTKYGPVKTDFILFIAAGAFHVSKISDLIPELQGRFPIKVNLNPLTVEDYKRILHQPEHAITKQYEALLATDDVQLEFTDDALDAIARYAYNANETSENIGARRLHTIVENLLEDISFNAGGDHPMVKVVVDASYVKEHMPSELNGEDLGRFIL